MITFIVPPTPPIEVDVNLVKLWDEFLDLTVDHGTKELIKKIGLKNTVGGINNGRLEVVRTIVRWRPLREER